MSAPTLAETADTEARIRAAVDFFAQYLDKNGKINASKLVAEFTRLLAEVEQYKQDAERYLWLVHSANYEEIRHTLLSREQPHVITQLIDEARK